MNFKSRIKQFGKQYLASKGFAQVTPWAFEKPLDGLCHGLGFVKGSRGRDGAFSVDVYWRFTNSKRNAPWAMDCHRRINDFVPGMDGWFLIEDEGSYTTVANIFLTIIEPFLKEHESVASIIHSLETGQYEERVLFGPDAGWRQFNIGFCYLSLGNKAKAIDCLNAVVEKYSSENYDWVQERRLIAMEGIERARQELILE